jgi:8-oxo-dGTP pyrophosphatase MutT (NUDIX family)
MSSPDSYQRLKRMLVAENSKFNIYFEEIRAPHGFKVSDHLVVTTKTRSADLVTGVAVLPIVGDKVALLKIYRPAIEDHSWEIPRGFMENNESTDEAALRELEEETGLVCSRKNLCSLGPIAPDPGILAIRTQLYFAAGCHSGKKFEPSEFGLTELAYFDKESIQSMIDDSVIQDPCTIIAYYKYLGNKTNGL